MDIRKWLEETVQPEAPHGLIERLPKSEPAQRKRRRKRSKSDSSLLDQHSGHVQKSPTNERKPPSEGGTEESASEARQATSSDSPNSSRYARRPRRKTRPEHYESSSKLVTEERGNHAHRRGKGESKKPRPKSRRKKSEREKPGSAIVQNFQAKNVSSDRLTLKPRELGLFNKGRTSAAVKGRGLPDLVFSEMKFLQRHKEQPEIVPQAQSNVPKKKRKKDHAQTKEGEISAYFTSVRPPLAEKDGNTLPCHGNLRETRPRSREKPVVVDAAIPTIEVEKKASYLGFGSRGPRHESTSYVSWSDPIRAPSTTPARPRVAAADLRDCQVDPDRRGQYEPRDSGNIAFKRPVLAPNTKHTTDGTSDRFRISSLVPSHDRISRSQPYPQATSSPRRANLIDRSAKVHSTDSANSPSSMPPFMPAGADVDSHHAQPTRNSGDTRFGRTPLSGINTVAKQDQHEPNSEYDEKFMNPHTSSDLEKVLEQCNTTFHERRQEAAPRRRHTERIEPPMLAYRERRHTDKTSYPPTQRTPTVRFADTTYGGTALPNFAGASIYEQQAQRRQLPTQPDIEGDIDQCSYYPIEHEYLGNDEMTYAEQDWEGLPEEPLSNGFEGEAEMYGSGGAYISEDEDVVPDLRPENNVVAPGFWRTNRLY